MGGNALSIPSVRLEAEPYRKLWKSVEMRLRLLYDEVALIPAYKTKSSFGDMDVLVHGCKVHPTQVIHTLGAVEEHRNGNVWSLGLPTTFGLFQLDLIHCPKEELPFAEVYFAYNDLGNLMGRIAHKMGFKYGHDGLWYVIRDPNNPTTVIKEVMVSRDLASVFGFMGYSFDKWRANHTSGFQTLEDVFKYVADNKWFDKDIYLLHNRNHTARVRDRKRSSYTAFLKWCEDPAVVSQFAWGETQRQSAHNAFLQRAFEKWPSFAAEYSVALGRHQMKQEGAKKFNGETVMRLTGLHGKELGNFMAEFKKPWFTDQHFWHWAVTVEQSDVDAAIKTAYETWEK